MQAEEAASLSLALEAVERNAQALVQADLQPPAQPPPGAALLGRGGTVQVRWRLGLNGTLDIRAAALWSEAEHCWWCAPSCLLQAFRGPDGRQVRCNVM